ncbi:hypothetical protein IV203_029481 [Nitzschia inconspicua]|uniref:Uncharacterized protein n=1 Tax=Nitzschia inconspicua TaxID=303405 RepID=A0A9K3LUD0_9STRA|nr:hypothetical protein IV203_029481 [Nitzschia inconspicua]
MIRNSFLCKILVVALAMHWTIAFGVSNRKHSMVSTRITVHPTDDSPSFVHEVSKKPLMDKMGHFATTVAVAVATSPLMSLAEEADDYEYGAVNAPIGIAWAGGVLAILTALLPIALRGGEEAFEEMRERDSGKFGTGDSSGLDRRRKR